MKFSIITAVFNRAVSIAQAVESVQVQTHHDVEHVVIDGGSSDGTLETLKKFSRLPLRCTSQNDGAGFVLVSEPDNGIYDALNKGFALATGDVVGLLHSDDFFADERVLERVALAFADPAVDGVYGDLDYVARDDPSRIVRRWRSGAYTRGKLSRGWMPPHPTLFLRRAVIERWGGFDTSYRIAADYDAMLRYLVKGGISLAYIPEVLVKMRLGGESNRSLVRILRKTREDYVALRSNGVGGAGALLWKNLSKVGQFFVRDGEAAR